MYNIHLFQYFTAYYYTTADSTALIYRTCHWQLLTNAWRSTEPVMDSFSYIL